jgi:elongation factor G
MRKGTPTTIKNVVIASYPGAGKTSLAEALVFSSGGIPNMGTISQGNSLSDFEPEETHHHHSISSALLHYESSDYVVNLIDCPGTLDFFGDTKSALHVADGVILVVGASGIRSEIQRVWEYIQERQIPCIVFINGLDKDRTDFEATVKELQDTLEIPCIPIAFPVGAQADLSGVIDLVEMQTMTSNESSSKIQKQEIPNNLAETIAPLRKQLVENVAELSDQLVEQYLAEGDLSQEDIIAGLEMCCARQTFLPVLCGSATHNIGTSLLHQSIIRCLPSPAKRSETVPPTGKDTSTEEEITRLPDEHEPFSAFVFKTTIDPFMGRLSYIRVYSGNLPADSHFFNATRNTKEKGGHIFQVLGKKYTQIERAAAGDIVAIGKLKDTQTGDTICADKQPIQFPGVSLTRPVMSFALEVNAKGDIDKVSLGLHKLVEEDPSLEFLRNDETKEMVLSGVGQTHIEMTLEKLKRKFGVEVKLNTPKVAYRESIHVSAQAQGKYKKQTGGHGQYGDCWLQLDPLPHGAGFEFHNKIVGGAIPRNFVPAVEKGVHEALHDGILAGYPVVDLSVTVYDGSYHPVDSSEMAFKVAGSMAFKKAMESAQPYLLEPVMKVEVTVPDELVGAVIGDLNSRRGRILGMDTKGHNQIVNATVPLSEVLKYAPALTSMTAGKGTYVMEFQGYEPLPKELTNKVVGEHKMMKEAVHS